MRENFKRQLFYKNVESLNFNYLIVFLQSPCSQRLGAEKKSAAKFNVCFYPDTTYGTSCVKKTSTPLRFARGLQAQGWNKTYKAQLLVKWLSYVT